MARSLKKGPYVFYKLRKKIDMSKKSGKNPVKKSQTSRKLRTINTNPVKNLKNT